MKRVIRRKITASTAVKKSNYKFTPMDVTQLLGEIEELKNTSIDLSETPDGDLEFTIGENVYHLVGSGKPTAG